MQSRILAGLAVSSVVHVGAFVVGAGVYDRFIAGPTIGGRIDTLSVSIDTESAPWQAADPPPAAAELPRPGEPEARRPEYDSQAPRPPAADQGPPGTQSAMVRDAGSPPAAPSDAGAAAATRRAPRPRQPETSDEASDRSAPPTVDNAGSAAAGSNRTASRRAPRPAEAAAQSDPNDAERTYLAEFLGALSKYKHYPRSARLREQQGRVLVELVLKQDGTINDVKVSRPSRHSLLNRAALRSVRRMKRFKPFPPDVSRSSWRLRIPFQYSMHDY